MLLVTQSDVDADMARRAEQLATLPDFGEWFQARPDLGTSAPAGPLMEWLTMHGDRVSVCNLSDAQVELVVGDPSDPVKHFHPPGAHWVYRGHTIADVLARAVLDLQPLPTVA